MPDNPEVTEENLEQLTNALEGDGSQVPAPTAEPVPTQEPTKEEPTTAPDPINELRELLKDTPYYQEGKDVKEVAQKLKEGYKSLQAELTQRAQKIKPFEPLLNRIGTDPQFASFIEQARTLYENPQMQRAYMNPTEAAPDPRQFDFYQPDQYQQFRQQEADWMTRQINSVVNTRLAGLEAANQAEMFKFQFKQKFPGADPETVLRQLYQWQSNPGQINPLEIAYKAMEFENVSSREAEKVRKELTAKMEEAGKNKTPTAPTTTTNANPDDVIDYIAKNGPEAAEKKWGKKFVNDLIRGVTEEVDGITMRR
jgi:hypothetical protein